MIGRPVRQPCSGVHFIPQSGIYEFGYRFNYRFDHRGPEIPAWIEWAPAAVRREEGGGLGEKKPGRLDQGRTGHGRLDQGRAGQGRGGAVLGSVLLWYKQLLLFYTIYHQGSSLVSGKVTNVRRTFQTWSVKNTDALRYSEPHRAFFYSLKSFTVN